MQKLLGQIAATAVAGLMVTSAALANDTKPAAGGDKVKCEGGTTCKGTSSCKVESGKAKNDCSGKNSCKGKGIAMLTAAECTKAHGKVVK